MDTASRVVSQNHAESWRPSLKSFSVSEQCDAELGNDGACVFDKTLVQTTMGTRVRCHESNKGRHRRRRGGRRHNGPHLAMADSAEVGHLRHGVEGKSPGVTRYARANGDVETRGDVAPVQDDKSDEMLLSKAALHAKGDKANEVLPYNAALHTETLGSLMVQSAENLIEDPELCSQIITALGNDCNRKQIVDWMHGHELQLALGAQCSCRVIQKMLDVLGGAVRDTLVASLLPGTLDLLQSQHGNHVLTKTIEVVPRPALGPIIEQLELRGGRALARHRFGCRVLERLLEHGTEEQLCKLLDQCIANSEELSRHQYANFVIQSLLEHGTHHQRKTILQHLLAFLPQLAVHRTASHVVQQALNHNNSENRHAIADSLLSAQSPYSLVDIAASRHGSYVVEELHNIFGMQGPGKQAQLLLSQALPKFRDFPPFVRVAVRFGILGEQELSAHQNGMAEAGLPTERNARIS